MKGQWIGKYVGDAEGRVMVNIDSVDGGYEAVAYINPSTPGLPATVAYLDIMSSAPEQSVRAYLNPVDPRTGNQCTWENIKHLFEDGVVHSESADVKLRIVGDDLDIDAVSNIGVTFKAVLKRPPETDGSKIAGDRMSWSQFKEYISGISKSQYLFRGQMKPWRLCTSFHRRGRFRINEFIRKDVP
jgi:hypothetical protein